jgi:hypothetical protein
MKRMRSIVLLLMLLSCVAEARIWKNRTGKELEAGYVKWPERGCVPVASIAGYMPSFDNAP